MQRWSQVRPFLALAIPAAMLPAFIVAALITSSEPRLRLLVFLVCAAACYPVALTVMCACGSWLERASDRSHAPIKRRLAEVRDAVRRLAAEECDRRVRASRHVRIRPSSVPADFPQLEGSSTSLFFRDVEEATVDTDELIVSRQLVGPSRYGESLFRIGTSGDDGEVVFDPDTDLVVDLFPGDDATVVKGSEPLRS